MTVSPFERSILVAPALAPPQGRVLLGHYGVANFRPLRRIEPQPGVRVCVCTCCVC